MRKIIRILYSATLIGVIMISVFLTEKSKVEAETYEKIRTDGIKTTSVKLSAASLETKIQLETVSTISETNQINKSKLITVDYQKMKAINSDYRCWIRIPDTKVSYPVVMTSNNDFYLHKTFDTKESAYAGTLFIDAYSAHALNQPNLIIYGHNMKDGSMFGTLRKFKNKEYFDQHEYIEIYTKEETRIYKIFSVRDVSSNIDSLNFKLDNFDKQAYIDSAINESIQSRNISHTDFHQIITLSTCVGDYSRRLLISAINIQ